MRSEMQGSRVETLYDHRLDTLIVHLYGREQRATNRLAGEYAYIRVDPQTERVVGLQIESFLRRAVREYPELIDLLRYAELRGASFDRVHRESLGTVSSPRRWLLRLRTGIRMIPPTSTEQPSRRALAAVRLFVPSDGVAQS